MASHNITVESAPFSGSPRLPTNQYIQDAIDAGSPGDTYYLKVGTHRGQEFTLASGDIFIMEAGAILSGAEDIGTSGWTDEGGGEYSYTIASDERNSGGGVGEESGFNPWNLENLIINGQLVAWADSSGGIDEDYAAYYDGTDVYIGVNPSAQDSIEMCRAEYIDGNPAEFRSEDPSERAKIYGYATDNGGNGNGILNFGYSGGSVLKDLEVYSCAGGGVGFLDGEEMFNVTIHHCGQLGTFYTDAVAGFGSAHVGPGCLLYSNAMGGWNNGWEGGNTKFADTDSLHVEGTWWDMGDHPYANALAPMWLDINNDGWLIHSCLFTDLDNHFSRRGGLFLEISYSGKFYNNTAIECGWDASNAYWALGIVGIDASGTDDDSGGPHDYTYSDLEFYGNLSYRCAGGLGGVMNRVLVADDGDWDNTAEQRYGYWESCNWDWHDNTCYIDGNETGNGDGDTGVWFGGGVPSAGEPTGCEWDDNIYLYPTDGNRFNDGNVGGSGGSLSWSSWNSAGMDTSSRSQHFVEGTDDEHYDPDPLNGGAM